MTPLGAYAAALAGNFLLSLGFTLQKRHVRWLSARKRGEKTRRADVVGWLAGFTLMNIQPIFNYLALAALAPNVVAAVGGSNIVFTILLSRFMLHEHLKTSRIPWVVMMTAGLAWAGFLQQEATGLFNIQAFWTAFFIPTSVALLALLLVSRMGPNMTGVALGSVAGSLGGFMVLVIEALRRTEGTASLEWFLSPYLYVYLFCGIASFMIKQVAFERGNMNAVAPSFYGFLVIYPSIAAYFVSGLAFSLEQAGAFILIAVSIAMLAL